MFVAILIIAAIAVTYIALAIWSACIIAKRADTADNHAHKIADPYLSAKASRCIGTAPHSLREIEEDGFITIRPDLRRVSNLHATGDKQ